MASQHIHRTASYQVESVAATENKIYASDRFIDFFYKDVFLRRKLLSEICRKIIIFISPSFVSEGVARKLFFSILLLRFSQKLRMEKVDIVK